MGSVYSLCICRLRHFECFELTKVCFSVPPTCRIRQPGLGADLSGPAPDDVLYEHGRPVEDRAATPQPAALPQEAETPHHLYRRAAGGSGRPLPGDQVPRRRHPGAASPQSPPPGGEGRGQSFLIDFSESSFLLLFITTHSTD